MTQALHELSTHALRSLASSLRTGALSLGISHSAVAQVAGIQAVAVVACLQSLVELGLTSEQIALIPQSIADARERSFDPARAVDLVLSGPDLPGIPTSDTAAVMRTLVAEARQELLLVGYAVHNAKAILEPIATAMAANPNLRVWFCLDIPRPRNDASLASELVRRFAEDFRRRHWPWAQLPQIFYDRRSLSDDFSQRSSLHAKCLVVDKTTAFVTSANLTQAAQLRNIEAGILLRYPPLARRLHDYFEGLRHGDILVECHLA